MSLTLPSNYEKATKTSNLKENWVCQLFNTDSYINLDGVNDYIDLGGTTAASPICVKGTSEDGGNGITIAFWINFPEVGNSEIIFASNTTTTYSGYWVQKDDTDKISFSWGDDTGSSGGDRLTMVGSTVLAANTWYFVVITSTFSTLAGGTKIYVNGATPDTTTKDSGGSASVTTPTYVSDGKAYIAREDFSSTNYGGKLYIKYLAAWNVRLDASSTNPIAALYNSGTFKSALYNFGNYASSSSLVGYWELNNGEPTIQDLSGNGLNGTINGGTYKGYLPLSLSDTTIDDVFYYGVITRVGSIRDSIDLARSTAKTSNISLNLANFKYKGDDLSAELFLGTRDYYNYNVRIYSQLNGATALSDCLQVYQGRLINLAHDQSNITLQLTEQRPWDFIEIPSEKVTTTRTYIPVVYGEFTANDSQSSIANVNYSESRALYPAPVESTSGKIYALVPRNYADSGSSADIGRLHHYEKESDKFAPIFDGGFTDVAEVYENAFTVSCTLTLPRGYITKPVRVIPSDFTNPENAIDKRGDDSSSQTSATNVITIAGAGLGVGVDNISNEFLKLAAPSVIGKLTELKLQIRFEMAYTGSGSNVNSSLSFDSPYSTNIHDNTNTAAQGNPLTGSLLSAYTNNNDTIPDIHIKQKLSYERVDSSSVSDGTSTATIYDVKFHLVASLDQANDKEGTKQYLEELDFMYVGGNGLTETYSGSNGEIEYGHEALRDMLVRFSGFDTADPDGWSALNTDRTANTWKIRYWQLEPTELKPVLERLMYEFGFIFKFRADGSGRVIHILQTSELSASQTLNSSDITDVSISTSSFDDMITKMVINYEKHPAKNTYLSEVTSSNDASRTKYKIKLKENIKEEKLKMNVGTPNTSGQTDPNSDFYSYYDNIFGDIKKIVRCEVVNPAKSYAMETGDVIQFSSTSGEMPVEPFGHGWDQLNSDFYMITKLVRNIGSVKIECREVG